MTTNDGTLGRYLRWFLAALSLGAGAIHFAVSGGHFDLSWLHGAFFAVVAWLQLAWAAAVILKPTRRLLIAGALGNAAIIGTWAVSRTWGVPVGPDAWTPEAVSLADVLATVFEGGIVLTSLAVLARPALAQRAVRPSLGFAGIGISGLAVAVVSTVALTPSFASDHHGDAQGNTAMAGHGHGDKKAAAHSDGVAGAANGHVKGHTDAVIAADGTSACEQAGVANEGNSGHGHRGPVPFKPVDAATRAEYTAQVALSNQVVANLPTTKEAEAAGYRRITPYVPCIAAHYLKASAFGNGFDPAEPEIVLYDGTKPDSRIVGLSYLQFADPKKAPEGFAGPTDPWHVHRQLCIGGGGVVGDESTTPEQCEARGGRIIPLENLWMNHMWNAPGWESRWGLFSSEHPDLGGKIGDINGTPEGETVNAGLEGSKNK
jgi:hypothetical protein